MKCWPGCGVRETTICISGHHESLLNVPNFMATHPIAADSLDSCCLAVPQPEGLNDTLPLLEHPLKLDIFADLLREPRLPTLYFTFTLILILNKQCCLVLHFRGWMKDSPKQMGSLCTRSVEPASPPFGQQNCPEMDSCAQGRAYRKWNHTQYLWLPQGLATHWPGHTAADRHTVGSPKFCTRSATIHHTFRLRDEVVLQESFCVAKCPVSLVYVTYYFNI